MDTFKKIKPQDFSAKPIDMIAREWMLITAIKPDGTYNSMTASWGGIGELWSKPVAFLFIRPQRYTHEFSEAGDRLTLTWFDESKRAALAYCGAKSGRDVDKAKECVLTPTDDGDGFVYYTEATRVMKLRKLYADELRPEKTTDGALFGFHYPSHDYHTVYICEILDILEK